MAPWSGSWGSKTQKVRYGDGSRFSTRLILRSSIVQVPSIKMPMGYPGGQECWHCEQQEHKEKTVDQECPGHKVCALTFELSGSTREWCDPWSIDQIQEWQKEDPDIARVLTWVETGRKPTWKDVQQESPTTRIYWSMYEQLETIDGILHGSPDPANKFSSPRLVAPRAIRDQIFTFLHANGTGGHLGINRTAASARKRFWWPGMKTWSVGVDIMKYVSNTISALVHAGLVFTRK